MQVIVSVPYVCTVENLSTIYRQKDNNRRTVFTVRFHIYSVQMGSNWIFVLSYLNMMLVKQKNLIDRSLVNTLTDSYL